MTSTYTFVNHTAARLFAEWWNRDHYSQVQFDGPMVSKPNHPQFDGDFLCAAEAFNAAAQSARGDLGGGS